jgi:hypothetical protein
VAGEHTLGAVFTVAGEFKCDRCGREIEGALAFRSAPNAELPPLLIASSGIYVRSFHWAQFMEAREQKVCDDCMKADVRFQKFMLRIDEDEAPHMPSSEG